MYQSIKDRFGSQLLEVEPQGWTNIYVVGDVHGCKDELQELVQKLELSNEDLLVCVGDIIAKGPDSAEAVEFIEERDNIITVKGNGEAKYLRGDKTVPELEEYHRSYIKTWPLVIMWPGNVVVHGGFNPNKSIYNHSEKDIYNMRSPRNNNSYETPFWFEEYEESTRVFFGHSATTEPIHQRNAIGLDTGCVYGNKLTAFDLQNEEFISVSAEKTYEPRDPTKYVDVRQAQSDNSNPATVN